MTDLAAVELTVNLIREAHRAEETRTEGTGTRGMPARGMMTGSRAAACVGAEASCVRARSRQLHSVQYQPGVATRAAQVIKDTKATTETIVLASETSLSDLSLKLGRRIRI